MAKIAKNDEFFEALALLEKEKGISGEYLLEKIRAAIIIAIKRDFGGKDNISVIMDPDTHEFAASIRKTVVDEIEDPDLEMLPEQAQRYSVTLLGIAITGLTVTNAALFFLMPEVVTWFNLSAEASAMCTHVVHWFNLFSIFFWATSFTLPNALRAGGDAKFTMSVSIVSMWLFRVILSYIFVLQFHLGLTGVWFGMFIDWICRSLCFLVRFARGKWMEHKVI